MNFKLSPNATAAGSSFHGTYIMTTATQIADKFGPAHRSGDKVDHEWVFETDDGDAVTLYDWKAYGKPSTEFHVGGHSKHATERFAMWFYSL